MNENARESRGESDACPNNVEELLTGGDWKRKAEDDELASKAKVLKTDQGETSTKEEKILKIKEPKDQESLSEVVDEEGGEEGITETKDVEGDFLSGDANDDASEDKEEKKLEYVKEEPQQEDGEIPSPIGEISPSSKDEMDKSVPFSAEYAPSDKATCKRCKENIAKYSLRISIKKQGKHDGKDDLWHHLDCFFKSVNYLRKLSEIDNFDNLRWDDQEKIKKKFVDKYSDDDSSSPGAASHSNSDFSVEYATASGSICRGCYQRIIEDKVIISKVDNDPAKNHYGHPPIWYHANCFIHNMQIGFFDSAEQLSGFTELNSEDQETLKKGIVSHNVMEAESPDKELTRKLVKEHNKLFFEMRDKIEKTLSDDEIKMTLKHNGQYVYKGKLNKQLDLLVDCLVFGALEICSECKKSPTFMNNKYTCVGNLSIWTRCQHKTTSPERKKFVIPEELQAKFQGYKTVVKERMLRTVKDDFSMNFPLFKRKLVLLGNPRVTKKLENLGARVIKSITDKVDLCIIPKNEEDSTMSIKKAINKAQAKKIYVVSEDFITDIMEGSSLPVAVQKNLLYPGGENLLIKFDPEHEKQREEAKKDRKYAKHFSENVTITVRGEAAVDAVDYQKTCHVYCEGEEIYSATLVKADAYTGKNSFYILQVLKPLSGSGYYLLRRWGRINTIIDYYNEPKPFDDVHKAIDMFKKLYLDKTKNEWKNRGNFQKKPGAYYLEEIDYGKDSEEVQEKLKAGENSRLSIPVQDLICLIFNIEAMEMTMIEFEIDLNIWPLGKICRKQILEAYEILINAMQILPRDKNESKITDFSNQFFTKIPHALGMRKPPLLNNEEIIKSKMEMLNSLQQIEFAYNIYNQHTTDKFPIAGFYEDLKTDIDVLEKDTDEYLKIEKYFQNTHQYATAELQEVFRVSRNGESENYYSKCKDFPNKKLLWHGSRIINYTGILSNGLLITPPVAYHTGSTFGKGVYFADTVLISARYVGNRDGTCLLLLCEVALGEMFVANPIHSDIKMPAGMNSTFVRGMYIPDPKEKDDLGGVEVPCGKLIKNKDVRSPKGNEYVVFDLNQINIKYLVAAKFTAHPEGG